MYPFRKIVSKEVYEAMLSLSTTERIVDMGAKFALIRSGGKKATGKLS